MTPRRRAGRDVHGIILLDKAAGISSNRAVQDVRRLLQARKAGHTGSLDPFATGMLAICLGEASKTAGFMLEADKRYRATAQFGTATETGDPEGVVIESAAVPDVDVQDVERILQKFRGPIMQVPPMHSALKHRGQPLYRLARRGLEVERAPRRVIIHRLELVDWQAPRLEFTVTCSKGTYVRTLAEDIARALGSCAHLVALRRVAISPFPESGMVRMAELEAVLGRDALRDVLLPVDAGLTDWPVVSLQEGPAERFLHGNPNAVDRPVGWVRVHDARGAVLGLAIVGDDGLLHPKRVFAGIAAGAGTA